MKYILYAMLALAALLLFLPKSTGAPVRNLPLLILILALLLLAVLIRFFKYAILMARTKTLLKRSSIHPIKCRFLPWASRFHGHYSITFPYKGKTVQIVLLSRKRKYRRYHFDRIDRLEFYRSNRIAVKSGKNAARLTGLVEVTQVGKQTIRWDSDAQLRVILFDRLPYEITDATRKEPLFSGDRICATEVQILDWQSIASKTEGT